MGVLRRFAHLALGGGVLFCLTLAGAAPARADWTTYHADGTRSGVDVSSATSPAPFSAAWTSVALSGSVWAQPLVYKGLVIVATEGNDVYALDESTGREVWHVNVGTPVPASSLACGDITPSVGITSTPVIDPASGELYFVADVWNGSQAAHTLFAYNALSGTQLFARNVDPTGSTPLDQLQRAGLALDDGRILIGFGGNDGDCGSYWGFLVSAPANDTGGNAQYKVPTAKGGAIWSGGGAPAIDAAGAVYVPTGNGASTSNTNFDHGDTVEKLDSLGNELGYFAPSSWAADNGSDSDLGSTNTLLLAGGLAYQGGKNGNGYLFSSQTPGRIGGDLFHAAVCNSFGGDAYANGVIYVACANGIRALSVNAAAHNFSSLWVGPSDANGSPIIAGGLVWVASTSNAKLYGLDPASGALKVTQSVPAMEHFTSPAASDGKLFIATGSSVEAFTIAAAAAAPAPAPAPPVAAPAPTPTPVASTPPSSTAKACTRRVALRLSVPRHSRIVRVSIYAGKRRIFTRRGRHLKRVRFRGLPRASFAVRVVETTARHHRLRMRVSYSGCRVVARRASG